MVRRSTVLSGPAPEHCFPENPPACFRQFCETDIVVIPDGDPNIEEIGAVDVSVTITKFHTLANVFGRKIVAQGMKKIETVFRSGGVRYTTSSRIPFCAVVATDCVKERAAGLKAVIEHVDFCQVSLRSLAVSVVYVLIPTFHTCPDHNSIRCDIRVDDCHQPGMLSKWKPTW